MSDTTLVVMAAGMGSRYGGLKQIDPVGPNGEIILEYSAYDAIKAGFSTIVFIIRRDIEETFREVIGHTVEAQTNVVYVLQDLADVPNGFSVPADRVKPWGTGHAVLTARDIVTTPFAVINADDFYGSEAFHVIGDYLRTAEDRNGVYDYCMVGYDLRNTLSEHGSVARGVCDVTPEGFLRGINERTRIQQLEDGVKYTENGEDWISLPEECIVSLNLWGFTPSVMPELWPRFGTFLAENAETINKVEYFLPEVVGAMLREGKARVRVLPTREKWYGVTYREDRPLVQAAIRQMIENGLYPERLWN
jgi:hypothetical protein